MNEEALIRLTQQIEAAHIERIMEKLRDTLYSHQRSRRHNFYINGLLDAMNVIMKMETDSDGQL